MGIPFIEGRASALEFSMDDWPKTRPRGEPQTWVANGLSPSSLKLSTKVVHSPFAAPTRDLPYGRSGKQELVSACPEERPPACELPGVPGPTLLPTTVAAALDCRRLLLVALSMRKTSNE